jgi:hypothetical protein
MRAWQRASSWLSVLVLCVVAAATPLSASATSAPVDGVVLVPALASVEPSATTTYTSDTRSEAFRGYNDPRNVSRPRTFVSVAVLAAKEVNEGIYVIRGARGTYVGQSGNITQRFSQHLIENGGRFTQAELNAAERFGVSGGKTAREIAEQQKIDEFPNGIDSLLNKRNPIGPRRFHVMPERYSRP